MGPLGFTEVIFILVLALLLFGPRRLPELGRTIGRGLAEFRRASNELRATIEDEVKALERDATPEPDSLDPRPKPSNTPRSS